MSSQPVTDSVAMRKPLVILFCLALLTTLAACNAPKRYEGNYAMTLGNYRDAVAAYQAELRENPDSVNVLVRLGQAHYRLEEYTEALSAFQHVLDVQPGYPQAEFYIGVIQIARGQRQAGLARLAEFRYPGKVYLTGEIRETAVTMQGWPDESDDAITAAMFRAWDEGLEQENAWRYRK